jgi:hypothetical protein
VGSSPAGTKSYIFFSFGGTVLRLGDSVPKRLGRRGIVDTRLPVLGENALSCDSAVENHNRQGLTLNSKFSFLLAHPTR